MQVHVVEARHIQIQSAFIGLWTAVIMFNSPSIASAIMRQNFCARIVQLLQCQIGQGQFYKITAKVRGESKKIGWLYTCTDPSPALQSSI